MQHHAVNPDASAQPPQGGLPRTVARVVAAGAGARLVLALPGCCAAWSYPQLFLAMLGALVWGAVVFRVTAVFLAAAVDATRPRVSRATVAVLGLVVAAIGAEAFRALADVTSESVMAAALEVLAVSWIAGCVILVGRRWRQSPNADRNDR
ncbi:hypothetical protein [Mitsuaria sp. 7]|uniref:hypothetical protein n=1 Tax=Mitsuaria sp. 7 TaxID=1658665 RepID=UPI0007DDC09A|nr:hypothetical protein [Mitsuaria sp. 7]ANH69963.1 hypothetical protein ABE85_24560 [Mitsuaria sp. 7]